MSLKWNYKYYKWSYPHTLVSIKFFSTLLLITACFSSQANEAELLNQMALFDSEFHTLSSEFYADKDNYSTASSKVVTNFDEILNQVNILSSDKRYIEAIQFIHNNLQLIEKNLDHPEIFPVIELLLEHDEINLANNFYQTISRDGDDYHLATVNLLFARYHTSRYEWKRVVALLESISSELSEENSAYALLLQGNALQNIKLHGQAEESYKKIPVDSIYYRYAQLNLAITQIRRDWLTSAQITIKQLTQHSDVTDDEFTNRVYLVLGYALLNKNYYRSAREVFRKVSQRSEYANRALLGIALCSINQNDLESALNALTGLKNKDSLELSVDESFLLITYVYEKLGQPESVIASSTEAMNYYETRIIDLQNINTQLVDLTQLQFEQNAPVFEINNNTVEYGKKFPKSFLSNYREILNFAQFNKNALLASKIEKLIASYKASFELVISELLSQKISYINSYLDQARYGLARLYDKSGQQN